MQEKIQYEYKTLDFRKKSFFTSAIDPKALEEKLNEYAERGWEVVSLSLIGWYARGAIVVFKRPTNDPALR